MYLPSQLYTTTLYMMVDKVKGGRRAPPAPPPGWADFSLLMNVRQKVAIATLCALCGLTE
jgi:hypothetical protein